MPRRSDVLAASLTALALAGYSVAYFGFGWLYVGRGAPVRVEPTTFDPGLWKSADAESDLRQRMVDDLVARRLKRGLERVDVLLLLGAGRSEQRTCRFEGDDPGVPLTYEYYPVGPARYRPPCDRIERLCLLYDPDGRLVDFELHDH